MIRRGSISPEPNRSSPIVQQQANNQSTPQQFLNRRISRSAPMRTELHDKKYIPTPGTPNNVHRHDMNAADNNNQRYSDISISPSRPPSAAIAKQTMRIQERTTTFNLREILSKARWSTGKKILVGVLVGALIIVPIVLGVVLTRSKAITTTTTTTFSIIVSALWSFDSTTADLYGVYNGQLVNGATYTPISNSSLYAPYVGYGRALYVLSALNQSFLVSTPFLDLNYTSFTIEAWIYSTTSYTGDHGVFGQCQCSTCANQCLYFIVRASRLYIGFTLNDLAGSLTLSTNTWYHIAFVYNYQTQQQILYLNGVQDTIKSNSGPYQGTNGSIQIGSTQVFLTINYFNGYIDNLKVVTRAKSSDEILTDASVAAYYSFDLPYPNNDNGPNGLNGTSVNTVMVTGRVNQAMRFTGSSSYFQAYGFYQITYGASSGKFSVSMWINPSSIGSCTFVQLQTSSTSCVNMLGISSVTGSTGQLIAQVYGAFINGPFLTLNTWTHISWTFSPANGYTLYVNGILFGATGASSASSSGQLAWLYIGYGPSCSNYYNCYTLWSPYFSNNYISNTAYQGSIDEIYIHNRELAQVDVTALANP
ncbi:unnamed protein product [Didymodactylos carnosus]|uniref:Uncharacterized protein n=1 Tax=Didymodactylos carnosus TaxID=1234261 RepID=A0A814HMA4_9BILA|nr:unnamed protein product [Didymodactylos carnosus]CAF1012096.1 unnamed protein product [Didymodactylos carnosus]CAF3753567.1 unnamed protein product [Didymodactylos carnosus]CAF3783468.1 unnamed protein product [Didymodactylos carnosus]